MPIQDATTFRAIFLQDRPLIDTRAPLEFGKGAFPSATNLPLLTDRERQKVGTCYKQSGREAAIALGHQLVKGTTREQRLSVWRDFARQYPEGAIYCYRGGLRSHTAQEWLRETGIEYPLIEGGYKAMRQFLLQEIERLCEQLEVTLISGKTGSGKTRVIEAVSRAVDLEGLAKHRGSTFGQLLTPQPSQIDFEHTLTISLMKKLQEGDPRIALEDESRLIGRSFIPPALQAVMRAAPYIVVDEPIESRIDVVVDDYIVDLGQRYESEHGEELGPTMHRDKLLADLKKIQKRLGGARHGEIANLINQAFAKQWHTGESAGHRAWIARLLLDYYDPMYAYQLERRAGTLLFRGSRPEVISFATQRSSAPIS
jgi:tRNA 2-selenouridine synthase